jgi:hypothetical protein
MIPMAGTIRSCQSSLAARRIPGIDALNGPGRCGDAAPGAYSGRCGYGPRLPLVMISPYARVNAVDHALTDQSSIDSDWRLVTRMVSNDPRSRPS